MNQIPNMKLALWNAHSVRNKAETIKEYINEHDLVTEAWLKEEGDEETIHKLEKMGTNTNTAQEVTLKEEE